MSTENRTDEPTVVIEAVDAMPPPPEPDTPVLVDGEHGPVPAPIESLRSVKAFLRPAALYLLGFVPAFAMFVFALTLQEPMMALVFVVLSLLAMVYLGCFVLRYWLEWRQRPYSLLDPRNCVLTFDQRGYVLLKWTGMDDSPPDSFRLGDYDVITPPKTLSEQTLFRRSNTLWLIKEGEEEPPPNRVFRDMLFVEEIRAAWQWHGLQPIQQQDDVIVELKAINDSIGRLEQLFETVATSLALRDEAIATLLRELRDQKSRRDT